MSGVASDIRKYFEEVKANYIAEMIKPEEFTKTMFEEATGLKDAAARAILNEEVKSGKLTVRWGRNEKNVPCQLYKVVK